MPRQALATQMEKHNKTFRQVGRPALRAPFPFRPKELLKPKCSITAEIQLFRLKYYCSFGRKKPFSAERRTFLPKQSYFSSFGFRPKLMILDCPLSVSAETLSVDHYRSVYVLKCNFQINVNDRLLPTRCVTLYL